MKPGDEMWCVRTFGAQRRVEHVVLVLRDTEALTDGLWQVRKFGTEFGFYAYERDLYGQREEAEAACAAQDTAHRAVAPRDTPRELKGLFG